VCVARRYIDQATTQHF